MKFYFKKMPPVLLVLILCCFLGKAQPCTIKLHEFLESAPNKNGDRAVKVGKEYTSFKVPTGENALRVYIQTNVTDFKKLKVNKRLGIKVFTIDKGNELIIHDWGWYPLTKNQLLSTNCYLPAGEITIALIDAEHPETVFAFRKITVQPNQAKVQNTESGFPYERKNFKIWTCKSIDDNWKAIGQTTKIKAGSCINLFFESTQKIKNLGMMRWGIFKVEADGKETYINQKDQGVSLAEWRRLSYEECDEFKTLGKYRIYISTKDDADAYFGVNNKNYFAKADLIVE
ncbi:MAG: hypothetical protein KA319_03245 [Ferruginibacter sp.]|nr:hypothetical protein [Ferruginibacter sp.]